MTKTIGIAGGTASGKSTLAEQLKTALPGAHIIHQDSYYKPEEELPLAQSPANGKTYRDYNHPDSLHLAGLAKDLAEAKASGEHRVIIVEGIFVLWDEAILSQLDLKIFIDCRADERIVRRLRRNMTWGLSFDEIADVYLNLVRFRHDEFVEPTKCRADLIVDGAGDFGNVLGMVREKCFT
jgi:uridine kinase